MDDHSHMVAARANLSTYNKKSTKGYIKGAPHIKHHALRMLYQRSITEVYNTAKLYAETPLILDLGAGEGSATLPFLELGARVVAVDISADQLESLQKKCRPFSGTLEIRCEDVNDALKDGSRKYDIVVANGFLHHVPDYLGTVKEALELLNAHGQFFSFQDPLRYDTVKTFAKVFTKLAYFAWRVFQGDVIGGLKRLLRRAHGVYLEDSIFDNAEYHVVRNGVDQEAIYSLLTDRDCDCRIITYFSTQNLGFQFVGTLLSMKNTFAIVAQKRRVPGSRPTDR
jgi:2-polyprenyl-3-methyl-5-hydroxy-6-metoxy-1,4-benzoquinol methylase